jgi:hypothetical protein
MSQTECKVSGSCDHRVDCVYTDLDDCFGVHFDVFQGGD